MQSCYLDHHAHRVHYLKFGHGPRLLIALHGFGDRARMFAVLEKALEEKYTVYALDLPFHGQTEWQNDTFSKADILEIVHKIRELAGHERLSLMAFSFGARLSQALLPDLAERLDKMYLLSPDGIHTKGMSAAVRTPMWARRLTMRLLKNPDWFLNLVKFGAKLRLVPGLILHFMTSNLTKAERFRRTFGCWFCLDSFYLPRHTIQEILRKTNLRVDVFLGAQDEMLHFKTLSKMTDALPNVRVFVLDQGHRVVGEELAARMLAE